MDWSLGEYERTAEQLEPAAAAVVEAAAPVTGDRVLDLGCGTGNAALLAAARGATVTGVDPASRLLDVARGRAQAAGIEATFLRGDAASIPLPDGAADVVVSVFGVIFAPDAHAAAAEMARVTAPGGRIVLSAWLPSGAMSEIAKLGRAAAGESPPAAPFAWHDRHSLEQAFGRFGFSVSMHDHAITFSAPSAAEYLSGELQHHPMWVGSLAKLQSSAEIEALTERMTAVLHAHNERPDRFAVTSRYVVARLLAS
jgi:ubiquinone/menaquinone biosynthesis C-methylase UbiE